MIGRPLVRISPNLTTVSSVHLIRLQFPVIITISLYQVNNQSYLLVMLSGSLGFAPHQRADRPGTMVLHITLSTLTEHSTFNFFTGIFWPISQFRGPQTRYFFLCISIKFKHRMPQYTSTYVWTPMVVLRSNLLDWGENPLLSGISQTVCSYADMFRICVLSLTFPPTQHSLHVFCLIEMQVWSLRLDFFDFLPTTRQPK